MRRLIQIFNGDRRAVSLVEYALLAGLVALVSVIVLANIGGSLNGLFSSVNNNISSA